MPNPASLVARSSEPRIGSTAIETRTPLGTSSTMGTPPDAPRTRTQVACTWPRDDIVYVSWSTGQTTPFPQIYDEEPGTANPPTSVNAQQWQKLSARAVALNQGRMNFSGGLSQLQACIDTGHPPECSGTELRPKWSWRDLWDEINCTYTSGSCNTSDDLRWTTELTWDQQP